MNGNGHSSLLERPLPVDGNNGEQEGVRIEPGWRVTIVLQGPDPLGWGTITGYEGERALLNAHVAMKAPTVEISLDVMLATAHEAIDRALRDLMKAWKQRELPSEDWTVIECKVKPAKRERER